MSELKTKSYFEQNPKKTILGINLVLFLVLELALRAGAFIGVVPFVPHLISPPQDRVLADINPYFGVWRYPNKSINYKSPCFNIAYSSNSVGARDAERELDVAAPRRAVILGDSFVEGLGVSLEDRMTNIAEEEANIEMLNFGVSGNFSSTQQWLLYRELATDYEHSEVFIFMLPSNDFDDNDPSQFPQSRYRPYLKENKDGDFELYYSVEFAKRKQPKSLSTARLIRYTLYNNVYVLNVIRQLGEVIERSDIKDSVSDRAKAAGLPSYDDYSTLDINKLLYGYKKIVELANGRPVTIFVIPRDREFMRFYNKGYNFRIIAELENFASAYPNVTIKDLLPTFVDYAEETNTSYEDFFISCDGHWSPLGNKVAAMALVRALRDNAKLTSPSNS